MSSTVNARVEVPAVAPAEPRIAVQIMVVVPQPAVIVIEPMSLVLVTTASGAVPVRVNVTGAIVPLTVTLWFPPLVMAMVGAGGVVIIRVADPVAIWP